MALRAWRWIQPTLHYWMQTEVHVFAFSVSANVLLSFFPFLIVMASITEYLLRWPAATHAIQIALSTYFPYRIEDWLWRGEAHAHNGLLGIVSRQKSFQALSILLLLFTANGIFEPLEVGLNKVWGCKANRSFVRNQFISLGLIFTCGILAMVSALFTGLNVESTAALPFMTDLLNNLAFKFAALPVSIFILFLVYWLLPNCKVNPKDVVAASIFVGFLIEILMWINLLTWQWTQQKMRSEYGPFQYSVTLILWSFMGSMLVLAGAEWSARKARERAERVDSIEAPHA
jgi:uncharacterized BrkB/YihY/UPF0761 family membrane protein